MVDRRGRGRRHGRGRRRWSESETESDSEDTEFDYIPRKRRDRRRGRYGRGESDDEINDIYDRRHGKQGRRYEPEMPPPAPVNTRGAGRSKRETFRDSVFSSYSSMKKAAVRLKYVEQKVKLKKQLEAEEAVEQARREKVIQANRDLKRQQEEEKKLRIIEEIRAEKKLKRVEREMEEANREVEEANRRLERSRGRMSKEQGSGDSGRLGAISSIAESLGRPLIPPARSYTLSSSGSSGSSKRFPAPPGRHQTRPPPNGNPSQTRAAETLFDAESAAVPRQKSILRPPRKQSTIAPTAVLPYATPRPTRKGSALGSEINHLLGADSQPSKNRPLYPPPQGVVKVPPLPPQMQNDFQASWLSRPGPALSVPQTARTDSVYVSVTRPKDRPIIPPGGLAPAPPGKKRQERKITSTGIDSASGNNKWTNRLRAKR
ncbi:hypothetical protein BD324DRAFT_17600 [Kockovaella imperatae]|uniref:Uncharacterized protein n=1 Tax=Kockovaella imperatae TaxID=4999 RepID=A0A1Y1URP5_9TREE|nr:hypothetical protein BD324DRAFT_17600 [Kockovaella imperatae]ORX40733.1 hypothetical protein BD324DRAFT_17600 [Kockovaella imperatae]